MHDTDTARQQCEFERANQEDFPAFIKSEGLAEICDLVEYRSADCYMTEAAWERGMNAYRGFSQAGGNVKGIEILSADEARKVRSNPFTESDP
jgi:hypothetical protein